MIWLYFYVYFKCNVDFYVLLVRVRNKRRFFGFFTIMIFYLFFFLVG